MNTKKDAVIAQLYADIENTHDIVLSNIKIKAIMDTNCNHAGWIFPGGRIIKNKEIALQIANQINKGLSNE